MVSAQGYGVILPRSKAWSAVMVTIWLTLGQSAQADTMHLLALGDSLTQGYGLPAEAGFVPQLEKWLSEQGHDVQIVNGGVSGDTTAGGLSRVAWSLTPDIDGMIVTLGGNDLLRGIDPDTSRENISGILDVAEENEVEVLLIGMSAPGNYGQDYKARFDALYPDLAEDYGTVFSEQFFAGIMENGDTPAAVSEFMQADGIHPNAVGVQKIVAEVGPKVEELLLRISGRGED
ncbi:arylesterase [Sagittula sp. SSi028]|uniref:arylesterase n=1 Tax=Sagittula sp. SSi028 TaxID=3400636 RepID=UPI003AF82B30